MNRRTALLATLLSSSLLLVGVACSSDDDAGGSGPTNTGGGNDAGSVTDGRTTVTPPVSATVEAACRSFANAVCAKLESCGAFALGVSYGDSTTCKDRNYASCATASTAKGQKTTPDQLNTCASAIPALTCQNLVALDFGPSCTFTGNVKNGDACGYGQECESGFCAVASDKGCGTCNAPTTEGEACVNGQCSAGFLCSDDAKCHKPGTAQVGDSCTHLYGCDVVSGAGCNSLGGKCITLEVSSAAGGSCGADRILPSPTKFTLCRAAAACSAIQNGKCATVVNDGESCTAVPPGQATGNGPSCIPPAKCVSGKCALPSATCE